MIIEPSEIFKVLSVDTRVRIIELLKTGGALGVKDISERLGITAPAVSQHLKILKQAGLVKSKRKGYWIPYSINEEAMEDCRDILSEVCSCGCKDPRRIAENESRAADMETLKKYELELQNELEKVRQRIKQLEDR
jgi:DNA-binding transcriptional ArsR family regulator